MNELGVSPHNSNIEKDSMIEEVKVTKETKLNYLHLAKVDDLLLISILRDTLRV